MFPRLKPSPSGWWLIVLLLIGLPGLSFSWWGNQEYPEVFPPQIEDLDRTLWIHGGNSLFPERYQRFRQRLVEMRTAWRKETNQWLAKKDAAAFQQTYRELVEEGTILLEASRQKSQALRMEIEDVIRPEYEQIVRLRGLTQHFDLGPSSPDLSRAEGLLYEAKKRVESGQFGKARMAVDAVIPHLQEAENHVLQLMQRYVDDAQLTQWNLWVSETIRWSTITAGTAIIVLKGPQRLLLYRRGQVQAEYPIHLGYSGLLDKLYEGDGATPEGRFRIIRKKGGIETKFYRALLLNYPGPDQKMRFQDLQAQGLIPPEKAIGGAIEIHGKNIESEDQTNGCIALENPAIEHIFDQTKIGSPVTIVGALNKDNEIVDSLNDLKEHIQHRQEQRQNPSLMSALLYVDR